MDYQTKVCGDCVHAVPNEAAANSADLATRLKKDVLNSCRESPPNAVAVVAVDGRGQLVSHLNTIYRPVASETPACSKFTPRLNA